MAVALVAHYLGPQLGIGQYLDRLVPPLVENLQAGGTEVTVLASPNARKKTPSFDRLGATVRVLPPLDYSPGRRYAWFLARFAAYCRRHDIDSAAWLSNPLVLPWHPPSLAVIHDVNEWKNLNKGLLRTRLRSMVYLDASLKWAKTIVAVSESTARDIGHFRPRIAGSGKLRTIVNGKDSDLPDLPPVPVPSPDGPFVLSVGRIDPKGKCLNQAVGFVETLRNTSRADWELHLVGGMNESTKRDGEAFLRSVAHLPWIRYHGHVDNPSLAEWYRRASGVIFLAEHEGFGLPVSEAVSFGRIVVVNRENAASLEAGGEGLVAIDIENPQTGAEAFLHRLETGTSQVDKALQVPGSWRSAAADYARLLTALGDV